MAHKIVLNQRDNAMVQSLDEKDGKLLLRLKGFEADIMCKNSIEVYLALHQFRKTGKVDIKANGELV